ncbi:helix-turn-helix domain-containing protein [Staphylococcus epidermidis]|uniref:helix-turn-helix domain-containing protein n=1 Tax=Staphylococcus epidermidis TaxID=1282 RepID=UPI00209675AE|nr:helix-turn-helix domain-containing protein [Staphylococcus epidermidis]MCG1354836.1 helix-turn-helix domain containing protein [Staphylococcus epidermidis]MCG1473439.1 helix-turn-helix domain containing protein [Staphylococcus epidermidis]MCO6273265.1 helix-turn-helix domain containing protein [Staphylococcus epidermidis]
MPKTKLQDLPTKQNTALEEKQIVFPVKYAKPKLICEIFNISYSTFYRLLKSYEDDNLSIEDMYIDISSTLTLVNVEQFEKYLKAKHKKYL